MFSEIDESAQDALYDAPSPPIPAAAPASFGEAEQQYRQAIREHAQGRCPADRLRQTRQAYDSMLESELVQPLSRLPASPVMRSLQTLLMPLLRTAHRAALSMDSMLALVRVEDLLRGEMVIPPKRLNELSTLVNMVIALSKGLRPG